MIESKVSLHDAFPPDLETDLDRNSQNPVVPGAPLKDRRHRGPNRRSAGPAGQGFLIPNIAPRRREIL